jgi:hypothetical protein
MRATLLESMLNRSETATGTVSRQSDSLQGALMGRKSPKQPGECRFEGCGEAQAVEVFPRRSSVGTHLSPNSPDDCVDSLNLSRISLPFQWFVDFEVRECKVSVRSWSMYPSFRAAFLRLVRTLAVLDRSRPRSAGQNRSGDTTDF